MNIRYLFASGAALASVVVGFALVACTTAPPSVDDSANQNQPAVQQPLPPATRQEREAQVEEIVVTGRRIGKGLANVPLTATAARVQMDAAYMSGHPPAPFYQDQGRENYEGFEDNGVKWAAQFPVSTFAVDVDSASYANMRRQLMAGHLPNPESIRVEELINYFAYAYPQAKDRDTPFTIFTEMGPSPWHAERKLLHVGINGWQEDHGDSLPPANLVFLIDVSGSMQAPNKIQLLKSAMKMMVNQLRPQDTVSIAVYAGAAGEVLAPTSGAKKATIIQAIENLSAGGSTNGGAGIKLAYNLARQNLIKDGVNRVILATDGDFNVGTTDVDALERLVEKERKTGVALTVLGFGTGNYNDHLMQKIAQIGNGNAAYIDNINEARKVLVEELGATLNIIAKDMKVQVEFNPAVVETYRLIGYETRHLNREDFNNDKVDAGDVGAGHTVTALYEITLVGEGSSVADPLRYGKAGETVTTTRTPHAEEVAYLKLRYKKPDEDESSLLTRILKKDDITQTLERTTETYQFSSAVAWLGQLLRNNDHVQNTDLQAVAKLATDAKGSDTHGYRSEFINLIRTAEALSVASHDTKAPADTNRGEELAASGR